MQKDNHIHIQEISNEGAWTTYFNDVSSPSFHQAWEWGEFQKEVGYDIMRLGIYDNEKIQAVALVSKIRSKRGNFLFIPHGPLFSGSLEQSKYLYTILLNYLKHIAQQEGFAFIRVAPIIADTTEHAAIYKELGFCTAPIYMHAETTWAIDLTQSEEDILKNMRKTTRYLIKKAQKDGIIIEKSTDNNAVIKFWDIYKETFTRENFTPFSQHFILKEFETFHANGNALFLFGKLPDNLKANNSDDYLAGSLIIFTQSTAYYHQGASFHTKHPVPYLMQWEAILEAKKRGCKEYNFYGIYRPGRTPKAWDGLTLFKKGFGGYQKDYLPTQDYIISKPKYFFSYLVDNYIAWKRGI